MFSRMRLICQRFINHLHVDLSSLPFHTIGQLGNRAQLLSEEANREGRERLGSRVLACYTTMKVGLDTLGFGHRYNRYIS